MAAAKAAQPAWANASPDVRGACFRKFANLLRQHSDELAHLEAISMGRPVTGYFDAFAAAAEFEHYAEAWTSIQGQASINTPGFLTMTLRQPYGVVAAIIPWNVPILFLGHKCAPSLMTGNTVILKSSEKAPLTSAKVAELVGEAGFPPGVFNIISGHGMPSGAMLSSHMDIGALTFTGSCRTGRLIQEAAAKSNLKKVVLELGGKSPAIIFEDANIEKAVRETSSSMQWNSGQVCMANSRIYVQKSVAARFIETFKKQFADVKHGDPTEPGTTMGPQADEVQYKNVTGYLEEGKRTATLALGGSGKLDTMNGYFVEPTIFLDVAEDAKIQKEEIFGPVANINTFETEAEALAKANDTEFGLYASVYTKDIDRAIRVAKGLESGYVGVNCTSPQTARDLPFGGYKASGQGREGYLHSMDNFLETKSVIISIAEN